MSFFGLFGNKAPRDPATLPSHSGIDNSGNTQPTLPGGGRKSVRLGQRELLYGAVRDVMIRAGVLVASYRFKVLSLDAQGREYLIMMDLLKVDMGDLKRLGEIEAMIVQAAKVRHDLVVTGVYWRYEVHTPSVETRRPEVTVADASASAPRDYSAGPTYRSRQRDEIEPFQHTVISLGAEKLGKGGVASSRKNQEPVPEFEDTRIIDRTRPSSPLSSTQYGDLE